MRRVVIIENGLIFVNNFLNWFENSVINNVPSHSFRLWYYRNISGLSLGVNTSICLHTEIRHGKNIKIGRNSAVNQHCYLDGRGGLIVGDNVNVGRNVSIYTASHDYNDPTFPLTLKPVFIENDSWIASESIILPGVHIGHGAVVAAGAVVTKNVSDFSVVAGNPAKEIKKRNEEITYKTVFFRSFY